jgi:hypothetical protein
MIDLSRPYPSRNGSPTIARVDSRIFTIEYFSECMSCSFCFDSCCQYGCDISPPDEANILKHAGALEARIGRAASEWFDNRWENAVDAPGGKTMRTRVYAERSRPELRMCVFAGRGGRGCALHAFALENDLSPFEVKPEDCHIFPLRYDDGALMPVAEIDEMSLICQGRGESLFRSLASSLAYYFGEAFVEELKVIEANVKGTSLRNRTSACG